MFLCVSRCLSGKLLKLFPNLRLKEEWIVGPEILLAAVPVGAFQINPNLRLKEEWIVSPETQI